MSAKNLRLRRIASDLDRHREVKTKLKIDRAIRDLVAMGLAEVVGKNALGQTVYRVTEQPHQPVSWDRH
jgi:hypothetical protein